MNSENVWEDLLEALDQNKIIPILGVGLLESENQTNVYTEIAQKLLEKNQLLLKPETCDLNLNNAAITFVNVTRKIEKLRSQVYTIYSSTDWNIPTSIKKLVKINSIKLYISTTFDNFLSKAIKNHRGPYFTKNISYSGNKEFEDIKSYEDIIVQNETYVVNIFGKANLYSDYVITDENLLEAIIKLYNTKEEKLLNLFDALRNNELLFIGCNFPDWLGKFFIRAITNTKFIDPQQPQKYISERIDLCNDNYTYFITNHKGYVFDLPPSQFINELFEKWKSRKLGSEEVFKSYIFISYTKADVDKAKIIKTVIEGTCPGNVWFDEDQIEYGDQYDSIILENIKDCTLFIPLISNQTINNYNKTPEPYFKKEWLWAKRGRYDMIENRNNNDNSFICPIIIDNDIEPNNITWLEEAFGRVTVKSCVTADQIKNFAGWIKNRLFPNE